MHVLVHLCDVIMLYTVVMWRIFELLFHKSFVWYTAYCLWLWIQVSLIQVCVGSFIPGVDMWLKRHNIGRVMQVNQWLMWWMEMLCWTGLWIHFKFCVCYLRDQFLWLYCCESCVSFSAVTLNFNRCHIHKFRVMFGSAGITNPCNLAHSGHSVGHSCCCGTVLFFLMCLYFFCSLASHLHWMQHLRVWLLCHSAWSMHSGCKAGGLCVISILKVNCVKT